MNFLWRRTKPARTSVTDFEHALGKDNSVQGDAPAEPSILADLLARLNALASAGTMQEAEALRHYVARNHGETLKQMGAGMGKISAGARSLVVQSAQGAAHLDPNRLGRILDRMDNLGDATLRQIEGRIGVTVSRDDRRHLQVLRDEMRKWLDARDVHLQGAQLAVDELNAEAGELREELLRRSDRFGKVAEITAFVARLPEAEALRHATPEAAGFTASLRRLLAAARFTPAG